MRLPYRIVIWMGCLCFFVLEGISVTFAMEGIITDVEQQKPTRLARSMSNPLFPSTLLKQADISMHEEGDFVIIFPTSKKRPLSAPPRTYQDTSIVSSSKTTKGESFDTGEYVFVYKWDIPTVTMPEPGPVPFFMQRKTYEGNERFIRNLKGLGLVVIVGSSVLGPVFWWTPVAAYSTKVAEGCLLLSGVVGGVAGKTALSITKAKPTDSDNQPSSAQGS